MPQLLTKLMSAGLGAGLANAFCADTADNQTATGTNQATAFETSTAIARFTTVASGTGCLLDNGARGDAQYIVNAGANTLLVYPHVGGAINGAATNAAFSLAAGSWAGFDRITDTAWVGSSTDAANTTFTPSGTGEGSGVATTLATLLSPLRVLGSGSSSHSDGTDTLVGSARWFLGNGSPSSDDSALLIGRSLTGSYSGGAHAIRDETTYTATGTGLIAYASFDSQINFSSALAGNHLHGFQARQIYSGAGLLNALVGHASDLVANGPVNAGRGLQVNDITGTGTVVEQSGVWINDLAKATTNYGVKIAVTSGANKYSIFTGTAQCVLGGAASIAGALTLTGNLIAGANNRVVVHSDTDTNLWVHGTGTNIQLTSIADDNVTTKAMLLNATTFVFTATSERIRITGSTGVIAISSGRLEEKQGAAITAANNLVLGSDGNYFQIAGATQINLIDNSNWQGGSEITLKFNSTPTVKHNQVVSGNNKPIILNGAADLVAAANNTLTLRYDSTDAVWYELARKV